MRPKTIEVVANELRIEIQWIDTTEKIKVSRCGLCIHEENEQLFPEYILLSDINTSEKYGLCFRSMSQFIGIKIQRPGLLFDNFVETPSYFYNGPLNKPPISVFVCSTKQVVAWNIDPEMFVQEIAELLLFLFWKS